MTGKYATYPIVAAPRSGYGEGRVSWNAAADALRVEHLSDAGWNIQAVVPTQAIVAVLRLPTPEPMFCTGPDGSKHVWSPGKGAWVPLRDA